MAVMAVRIHMALGAPNARGYSNTVLVTDGGGVGGAGTPAAFLGVATGLALAFSNLASSEVYFTRVTVTNAFPPAGSFPEDRFVTAPLSFTGQRGVGAPKFIKEGQVLCVRFHKDASSGNPGKLDFRNALFEDEVDTVNGKWVLNTAEGAASFQSALTEFLQAQQVALGEGYKLCMVRYTTEKVMKTRLNGTKFIAYEPTGEPRIATTTPLEFHSLSVIPATYDRDSSPVVQGTKIL